MNQAISVQMRLTCVRLTHTGNPFTVKPTHSYHEFYTRGIARLTDRAERHARYRAAYASA